MEELPDYTNLKHGFGQIPVDRGQNMEEAPKAMIAHAVKMIQTAKEPRPKRAKTKKRGG